MIAKQELRKQISARRKALDADWLQAASARVGDNLLSTDVFQKAKTVALYMAFGGEVDLSPLFSSCWKLGKRTCIPVFNAELKLYEMAEITADTSFRSGRYGIKEPISPALCPKESIDLMAVPGLAFDPSGNRLGRGGGYYDRLLEGFKGVAAAVAFDFQILSEVPFADHDKPVDFIISETKVMKVRNEY